MNQGRLSTKFRDRTKQFAAATIRLFIKLPRSREEARILGKQVLRSGTDELMAIMTAMINRTKGKS